jgi:hypothetical protein
VTLALAWGADNRKGARSWASDNGNGTYSNPLFYDEFSDPDMIRVGADYYLTGTTMHTMPGLPIMHSRDLVNWRMIGYAFNRLDLGPAFRLEDGKEIYGQGIWAPSFRYHKGIYYIFANVNRFGLQVFRASDPRGPWKHEFYDQTTGELKREPLPNPRLKLRVHCNFDVDSAQFSYSIDGREFKTIGGELKLPFQLKTFQGVRYSLFHFNTGTAPGGQADFNGFDVSEPRPRGLTKPIPYGKRITFGDLSNGNVLAAVEGKLQSSAQADHATGCLIVDRGRGRVALQTAAGTYVSVGGTGKTGEIRMKPGKPGDAETFQWVDLQRGDTLLMSLATHCYIVAPRTPGPIAANHAGPPPDRKDGSCFQWRIVR